MYSSAEWDTVDVVEQLERQQHQHRENDQRSPSHTVQFPNNTAREC